MMQSTVESCLACCLLKRVGMLKKVAVTKKLEREWLWFALRYSRDDFVAGHLAFLKRFGVASERILDNPYYFEMVKQSPGKVTQKKVTLKLLDELLPKYPIVSIDTYYLASEVHYPHFVMLLEKKGDAYKMYESWEGKEIIVKKEMLSKALSAYRNHLKMCPQVIVVT